MPISLGGIASGIDTGSLVDSLVSVARQPINQLATRKSQVDSASQTVTSLSSKLSALKTAALALSTSTGFSSFSSSSSDAAVVASTSGAANVGTYAVSVSALARAQKSRSATFASSTTSLDQFGTLDLKVGADGTSFPIEVVLSDTLSDIAAKISASGARVSASVMNDGTGARLLLQGMDSGAENAFTMTQNGVALGLGAAGNTYEAAQDAAFTIDGMPATSKTNQVTGVIPGLKLALTKVTTLPATVQVTTDPAALKTKVTSFITAYNDFVNAGHLAAGFGGAKATNSVLSADSAVRTALHRVGGLMGNAVAGTSGRYTTMGSIGLKTSREGILSLDATKFEAAIAADPESVRKLFVTEPSIGATGLMKTLMSAVDDLVVGDKAPLQARLNGLGTQSRRLATSQSKMEGRLADYEAQLKKQFTQMDQMVSKYKTQSTQLSASIYDPNASNG